MKKTSLLPNLFIFIAFFYSLTHLPQINQITRGVYNDVLDIFTSIFIWMILFAIANNYNFFIIIGKILNPIIYPILKLSSLETAIYISSIFSGYPTNIKIIKESGLNENRQLHLIKFSSHPSIGFVVYILGSKLFNSIVIGYYLLIIQITSNLILGMIVRKGTENISYKYHSKRPFIDLLKKEFKSSFIIFIYIFGFMLVSRIIIEIIPIKHILITGLLEFSSGCLLLTHHSKQVAFIYASFFLSFSSLSVILQALSILEKNELFFYFVKYRLFQGLISTSLAYLISVFIF